MRQSKTLPKLRAGEPVRLGALGHFVPSFIRHAAHFGFDCIWLDLEHRAMTDREIQALFSYCHMYDIDCMVRTPTLEKIKLYRYLEDGATGLMIPHVSTVEKAQMIVNAVKFPPIGDRGFDGAGLDSDFILKGGKDYPAAANRETFIAVQIETPEAVQNVDAIAAVEGIDALFLGPGDLGLRLTHDRKCKLTVEEAQEQVAAAAAKHDKAWGRPARTEEDVAQFFDQGAQLIAFAGEYLAILFHLEERAAVLDRIYSPEK